MLNRPFGLSVLQHNNANEFNARITRYRIPSGDGSQYSVGDTVMQVIGADARGIPNIQKHNGTSAVRGVFVGIEVSNVTATSLVATTLPVVNSVPAVKGGVDYYVYIMDDPDIVFAVQDDGITTGNLVANSANKNCNLTIANPAQPYQFSASVILSTSIAVGATLPVKLQGLVQQIAWPGNFTPQFGAYAIWLGHFNQHELMGNQAGV